MKTLLIILSLLVSAVAYSQSIPVTLKIEAVGTTKEESLIKAKGIALNKLPEGYSIEREIYVYKGKGEIQCRIAIKPVTGLNVPVKETPVPVTMEEVDWQQFKSKAMQKAFADFDKAKINHLVIVGKTEEEARAKMDKELRLITQEKIVVVIRTPSEVVLVVGIKGF